MNDPKECPEEILEGNVKEGEASNDCGNENPGSLLPGVEGETENPLCETARPLDAGGGEADEAAAPPCEGDPQVLGVSDHPDEDPHPDPAEDERRKLLELREELKDLERQIDERREAYRRLERECAEFRALYPETPLSALSDKVWADVQAGVPMAAAFALAERKRALLEAEAERMNLQNKRIAPEGLSGSEEVYFSPAEVKLMTPEEVRKNYEKIIQSMEKWN